MINSMTKYMLIAGIALMSTLPYVADARGESHGEGSHGSMGHSEMDSRGMQGSDFQHQNNDRNYNSNYGHNYDHNYQNYNRNDNYGGGLEGVYPYQYISPTPPPGSQPGMSDDSNALYDSYLRHNSQGR